MAASHIACACRFCRAKAARFGERLEEFQMHRLDIDDGVVLEKGCVYVVQLQERVSLPRGVHAAANAKSSTGRLDLLTRLVADGGTEFDRVDEGYRGPLYAEICPRSFLGSGADGFAIEPDSVSPGRDLTLR